MASFSTREWRCIVSNFYIKSQQSEGYYRYMAGCIVSNFYIKSQHGAVCNVKIDVV